MGLAVNSYVSVFLVLVSHRFDPVDRGWIFQIQCLIQIIVNRVCVLLDSPTTRVSFFLVAKRMESMLTSALPSDAAEARDARMDWFYKHHW